MTGGCSLNVYFQGWLTRLRPKLLRYLSFTQQRYTESLETFIADLQVLAERLTVLVARPGTTMSWIVLDEVTARMRGVDFRLDRVIEDCERMQREEEDQARRRKARRHSC